MSKQPLLVAYGLYSSAVKDCMDSDLPFTPFEGTLVCCTVFTCTTPAQSKDLTASLLLVGNIFGVNPKFHFYPLDIKQLQTSGALDVLLIKQPTWVKEINNLILLSQHNFEFNYLK